jgi:predicted transcriptional regulator
MNNIKSIREANNILQGEIATASKCKQSCFSHYERGERSIRVTTANNIVRGFNNLGVVCVHADVFPFIELEAA